VVADAARDQLITVAGKEDTNNPNFYHKFYVGTWQQVSDYSPKYFLYSSKEEYEEKLERQQILNFLRKVFDYGPLSFKIPLEKLKTIKEIIDSILLLLVLKILIQFL
jgi:hypothetical protein